MPLVLMAISGVMARLVNIQEGEASIHGNQGNQTTMELPNWMTPNNERQLVLLVLIMNGNNCIKQGTLSW